MKIKKSSLFTLTIVFRTPKIKSEYFGQSKALINTEALIKGNCPRFRQRE
jgi:hypothetical protein